MFNQNLVIFIRSITIFIVIVRFFYREAKSTHFLKWGISV